MKIEARDFGGGDLGVVLSEVYSGVGIETDMGLFGIAQRDGGIEIMLNGKTVWTSHGLPVFNEPVRLPDGSGFMTASFPLPKDHWLYSDGRSEPPMPMRVGVGRERDELAAQIKAAARYAIRASTMCGKEKDFDPDAMVQNMVVGLLGYWTESGLRGE